MKLSVKRLALLCSCVVALACGDDDTPTPDASALPDGGPIMTDAGPDMMTMMDSGPDAAVLPGCAAPADAPCDGMATGPGVLNEHAAGYFDDRKEMIVFGGNTAVPINCSFPDYTYNNNTWIYYDYDGACGGMWAGVTGDAPSPRGRHTTAVVGDSFYVFGGRFRAQGMSGAYTPLGDFWRFDANTHTWTEISPSGNGPSARYNAAMAYDETNGRLLMFGGNTSRSGGTPAPLSETWSYDIAANTWTQVMANGPSARMWHASLVDTNRNQLVVWGGGDVGAFTDTAFGDLWAFSFADNSWTELHTGNGIAPDTRFWGNLVYDSANDRYVAFGGHDVGILGNRNDTWSFNPMAGTWDNLSAGDTLNNTMRGVCMFPEDFTTVDVTTPERRQAATMVWSNSCNHAVLFGGKTDCGATNDLWHFDDEGWEVVFSSGMGEVCVRANDGDASGCEQLCF